MLDLMNREKIMLMLSAFVFCIFFPLQASYKAVMFCGIIGLICAALICFFRIKHRDTHIAVKIISAFMSAVFLYGLSAKFIGIWRFSASVERVTDAFSLPTDVLLVAVCVLLSVLSLPFLNFVFDRIVFLILYLFRQIRSGALKEVMAEECNIKALFKNAGLIILNLAVAVAVGSVLLVGIFNIPTSNIRENVRASASVFEEEGTYPSVFSWCHSSLDNFTDAIMLLEAENDGDHTLSDKAMMVYRSSIDDCETPDKVLVSHHIDGEEYDGEIPYPRYWHGFLVFVKPLLSFMDYPTLRLVNGIIQLISVISVSLLMLRRKVVELILPYWLSYLMLVPVALAKSLQFSSCFYIITAGMIALLLFKDVKNSKAKCFVFLNLGILTAYFDFLTYPIATLGVPCALYLYLASDEKIFGKLIQILKATAFWGIGYIGMWASKWMVGSLITHKNIIADAFSSVAFRTSGSYEDTHFYRPSVIFDNISDFIRTPITALCVLLCIYFIFRVVRNRKISDRKIFQITVPYFIVGSYPFMWYIFATNHSAVHHGMTSKACIVALVAIMFGIARVFIENKKQAEDEIHG